MNKSPNGEVAMHGNDRTSVEDKVGGSHHC